MSINGVQTIGSILARIAALTGDKTDSALAVRLGMSRQSLSNARRRGTIPYEKICAFAEEEGIPLDYILLGKGSYGYGGEVDPVLLESIGSEYVELTKGLKGIPRFGPYHIALVYNRVIKSIRPGETWGDKVREEVLYLLGLLREQDLGHGRGLLFVHPEEQRALLRQGTDPEEAFCGPIANSVDGEQGSSKGSQAAARKHGESRPKKKPRT